MKSTLMQKTRLFFASYLVAILFVSCGQTGNDGGETSVNLAGAQAVLDSQFKNWCYGTPAKCGGVYLYAQNENNADEKLAINITNAPQVIPFPNGKYRFSIVGIRPNDGAPHRMEMYCGNLNDGTPAVIELKGGEVELNFSLKKSNCTKPLPMGGAFVEPGWRTAGPGSDQKNIRLLPCDNLEGADSAACPSSVDTNVQSALISIMPVKMGQVFQGAPNTNPFGFCVNGAEQFQIPTGDRLKPLTKGLFKSEIKLFDGSNCTGNVIKNFIFNSGLDWAVNEYVSHQVKNVVAGDPIIVRLSTIPPPPSFVVGTNFDLGPIPLKGYAFKKFIFKNFSTNTKTLAASGSVTVTGGYSTIRAGETTCVDSLVMAPDDECEVMVEVNPTAKWTDQTLNISYGGGSATLSMQAIVPGPAISVSGTALDPQTLIGVGIMPIPPSTKYVQITNHSGIPGLTNFQLILFDVGATNNTLGWSGGSYPGTGGDCPAPNTMGLNTSCNIEVELPGGSPTSDNRASVKFTYTNIKGTDIEAHGQIGVNI
jgi:hypothetical protein